MPIRSESTAIGVATTTPTVDLPASIVAGETLLGVYRAAGAGAITFPAGWEFLINGDLDGSDDVIAIAWKKAVGDEGATMQLGTEAERAVLSHPPAGCGRLQQQHQGRYRQCRRCAHAHLP